jgi:3-oxoacyl-[acyl-carrier protein] reductase
LTSEILDQHYYINIRAPILLAQAFVTGFRKQKVYRQGRIITLTSGYETEPNPGNLAYSATKAAMNRFTNSLALEVAPLGITVNAVDPGPTDTGWMESALKESLLHQAPMKRLGMPDDVANLIEFLISEKSQWITGQILHSRGGL